MTTDIVVDLGLKSAEEVALLATVVDAFVQQFLGRNRQTSDAPEVMVRTAFSPDGMRTRGMAKSPRLLSSRTGNGPTPS